MVVLTARDKDRMKRRDFVRLGCATVIASGAARLRPAFGQSSILQHSPEPAQQAMKMPVPKASKHNSNRPPADYTPQIVLTTTCGASSTIMGAMFRYT